MRRVAILAAALGVLGGAGCGGDESAGPAGLTAAEGGGSISTSFPRPESTTGTALPPAGTPGLAAAPPPRATPAECEKLHEVSIAYGREMLESSEKDSARRAALFTEMDEKLAKHKDEYMRKCGALQGAGVTCATAALEKRDTVALVSCPIDISVLEPD